MRFFVISVFWLAVLALALPVFAQSSCGNGLCDPGENQCTCEKDCGSCSGNAPGFVCRHLACSENLCRIFDTANCCGNKTCESGENYLKCPVDCKPTTIQVNILYPTGEQDYVARGQSILIKAEVIVDGQKTNFADITAKGFFGEKKLENDGKHADGTPFDHVFANTIKFPQDMSDGTYSFTLAVESAGLKKNIDGNITIKSKIEIQNVTISEEVFQGNILNVSGRVFSGKAPTIADISVSIQSGYTTVLEKQLSTGELGDFSFSYPISFLDPIGEYSIILSASDENGNTGGLEAKTLVKSVEEKPLETVFLTALKDSYERGESVDVALRILSGKGAVAGAGVSLFYKNALVEKFFEFSPGNYSVSVPLDDGFDLGPVLFTVKAVSVAEGKVVEGAKDFNVLVVRGSVSVEIVEPTKNAFGVGESVPIKVKAFSPSNKVLSNARVSALVNGREVSLGPVEYGLFGGNFVVQGDDVGQSVVYVRVVDSFGNEGAGSVPLEFAPFGVVYFLQRNIIVAGIIALIVVVSFPFAFRVSSRKVKVIGLSARERELNALIDELQDKYYKKKQLKRNDYVQSFNSLTAELLHVKSELRKHEKA